MILLTRLLAILIMFGLSISILGKWTWIPLTLVALWYIIRFLADIFWWGKDKNKW